MTILEQMLLNTDSAVILGHVRPDGDCLGSAWGCTIISGSSAGYPDSCLSGGGISEVCLFKGL